MSSIQYAIRLNNGSISMLSSGQTRSAMMLFTKALTVLRDGIHNGHDNTIKTLNSDLSSMDIDGDSTSPSFYTLTNLRDQNFFLYNRVLTLALPTSTSEICKDDSSCTTIYSACVVLNMALVYHSLAKRDATGHQQALVAKAEQMYKTAIKLLGSQDESRDHYLAYYVRLVCANNLAHIYLQECKYTESKAEMNYVSAVIQSYQNQKFVNTMSITTTSFEESATMSYPSDPTEQHVNIATRGLIEQELDSLTLNILLWTAPSVAPAA